MIYFRNPLTKTGALGSAIAIVGVMLYSLAKAKAAPPPTVAAAAGPLAPAGRRRPKLVSSYQP